MHQLIGSIVLVCGFMWTAIAGQQPVVKGTKPASPDAPFIGSAAMESLATVEHSRLATQNASSADVKQFAQRIIDDHRKAGDELKGLASPREIVLDTKLDDQHRATQETLAKLTGADFDKAYMAQMLKAHLQAVALFQQEMKSGQDRDVKAWATKRLPTLQEHVKTASTLTGTVGKAGKQGNK